MGKMGGELRHTDFGDCFDARTLFRSLSYCIFEENRRMCKASYLEKDDDDGESGVQFAFIFKGNLE